MSNPVAASSIVLILLIVTPPAWGHDDPWLTPFERSGGVRTPRYDETMEYCGRLAAASPWVHVTSFGTSPQGRSLPLVILSNTQAWDPAAARASGKAVILVQSGIHAGEIDGKDASLMLMRNIAVRKTLASLLDSTVLLFVPIFNVDGHERFGPYNRINQNGPEETGWRVSAQNLNLNRDYMKAEAPEMQAMLRLFTSWLPDLAVDCHVTDGIDFQYDITYAAETGPSMDPGVSRWIDEELLPPAIAAVENAGHKVFYYVFPREDHDLSKGLTSGASAPRFSTGYGAAQNRPFILIETHMLKPYRMRVEGTYHFLRGLIAAVNSHPSNLKARVRQADEVFAGGRGRGGRTLPLLFGLGQRSTPRLFLGVRQQVEKSTLSGGERIRYFPDTMSVTVPFYDDVTVADSVVIPFAYLVPQEWRFVAEKLAIHGVRMERLKEQMTAEIESYRFNNVRLPSNSFEGRQLPEYTVTPYRERRSFPRGTIVVPTAQRAGKVLMHLLEPRGPDSFAAWGFFNAIFEQKEYAEAYVMEEIGARLLSEDPVLKREYEETLRRDTVLARSPGARLNWLYTHSPWRDPFRNVYPVARLMERAPLVTETWRPDGGQAVPTTRSR
ncbi:MAG: M14 family metallopeptidase [Bacteroidota bacterium]